MEEYLLMWNSYCVFNANRSYLCKLCLNIYSSAIYQIISTWSSVDLFLYDAAWLLICNVVMVKYKWVYILYFTESSTVYVNVIPDGLTV